MLVLPAGWPCGQNFIQCTLAPTLMVILCLSLRAHIHMSSLYLVHPQCTLHFSVHYMSQAQNIKNFKSQRWQTLLNFNSQRRLLLTGTPLQNNLMELWSLMHFLMPHVFQSHMDFKEWFANPLTGMIEGTNEYNDKLIRRLHKVTAMTYKRSLFGNWLKSCLDQTGL